VEEVGLWEVLGEIVVEAEVRVEEEMSSVRQALERNSAFGGLEWRKNCLCAGRDQLKGFFRFLNYNKCWMRTCSSHSARLVESIAHCAQNARFFGCSSFASCLMFR
jgi:hypothetical protein